jgi:hypothetical protein
MKDTEKFHLLLKLDIPKLIMDMHKEHKFNKIKHIFQKKILAANYSTKHSLLTKLVLNFFTTASFITIKIKLYNQK